MSTCPACGEYYPDLSDDDICDDCMDDYSNRRMSESGDDNDDEDFDDYCNRRMRDKWHDEDDDEDDDGEDD